MAVDQRQPRNPAQHGLLFTARAGTAPQTAPRDLAETVATITEFLRDLVEGRRDLRARVRLPSGAQGTEMADLVDRFVADMAQMLTGIGQQADMVGVGAAKTVRSIAATATEQSQETAGAANSLAQARQAGQDVAGSAERASETSQKVLAGSLKGRQVVDAVVDRVVASRGTAEGSAETVRRLITRSSEIDQITEAIREIADQTNLLALNATIEAARAGEHGRGFSVVATEVRKLAERTRESTKEISRVVRGLQREMNELTAVIERNVEETERSVAEASSSRATLSEISELAGRSNEEIGSVAAANEEIAATIEDLAGRVTKLSESSGGMAREVEASAGSGAVEEGIAQIRSLLARYRLGTYYEQVRDWAQECAVEISCLMERAIDERRLTLDQLTDWRYEEIKGPLIRRCAQLFDIRRVPPEGFTPPKWATRWDNLLDVPVRSILDEYGARGKRLSFVACSDVNGYLFTYLTRLCRDWTGDPRIDGVHNRVKLILDRPSHLRASRVGIKGAERVQKRATRSDFQAVGVNVDQEVPPGTFVIVTLPMITGETVCDLAVPLFVKGRRFGAVRIGFPVD